MKYFLHKIDAAGLFIEDCFWDDGAYPEIVGVPKMTAGSPAVPAVEYQAATETTPEVLAVAAIPEVLPIQEVDAQGNLLWTTEPVPAFAGNPIPADLIETQCQGGFMHPKWNGIAWVEGGDLAVKHAAQLASIENQIKSERDRRKNGGTLVSGKWFHSDTESRVQQLGLVTMGAAVPAVQWKTMDGTFVTMSQTLAGGIFQATATLDMTLYAVAEGHINAVKAMADPITYDYSTGWPARYEAAV